MLVEYMCEYNPIRFVFLSRTSQSKKQSVNLSPQRQKFLSSKLYLNTNNMTCDTDFCIILFWVTLQKNTSLEIGTPSSENVFVINYNLKTPKTYQNRFT